ncbi:hypothetical protein [Geodermatophilus maliterrae]|uniref:Uncharacterized protein n=1 Tax=Geodermatophilus maliterrae TaxID=3162531 RepID=A0ABV3XIN0_9ACTN
MGQRADGTVEVAAHQVVRNRSGAVLADGVVRHVHTSAGDLVRRTDVEV